jgi:hypothetical protein
VWRCGPRRVFDAQTQLHVSCYTTRCVLFRGGGEPARANEMPQRYDSRAASWSDCPAAARHLWVELVPSPCVASCTSTCCAAGSWWVATHAASSLGESTLRNLKVALACADARRWHHGPHGVGDILAAWSNPRATQSPGVPSCALPPPRGHLFQPAARHHACSTSETPPRRADRSAERPPCPWPSRRTRQGRWIVCSVSLGDVLTKHHEKSSSHEKRNR